MENKKKEVRINIISRQVISLLLLFVILFLLYNFSNVLKEAIQITEVYSLFYLVIPKLVLLLFLFYIFKILFVIFKSFFSSKMTSHFIEGDRIKGLTKLFQFSWWTLYFIIGISLLINNLSTLVASAGLIGLGLTFALQKPILNFVGWLTVITKDLYHEGDRIKIGSFVGDVKEIQLMNTIVYSLIEHTNTRSHKIMSIPNEMILTTSVENYTKDSNYIKDELLISITYESDYRLAMKLLKEIVQKIIKENIKSYIKKRKDEREEINKLLLSLIKKGRKHKSNTERLDQEKEEISQEIKELQQFEDEFNPRVRLEMADSSLILVTQFLTPYYNVKKTRSEINLAFLDAIKNEKSIEIAYPHLELVNKDKKKPFKF